jgi:hypothetical protein
LIVENLVVQHGAIGDLMLTRTPLRYDDILDIEETEIGQLALKRLPPKESYDRIFRIRRAMQLSLSHQILPKEEWTKMEHVSLHFLRRRSPWTRRVLVPLLEWPDERKGSN